MVTLTTATTNTLGISVAADISAAADAPAVAGAPTATGTSGSVEAAEMATSAISTTASGANCWQAVGYLRLSREDVDAKQSGSIGAQRMLIEAWAKERCKVKLVGFYTDDGYSGASFERPGFKRMISDAGNGVFDTIVVKDLSRFGRSYLDCGNWIERKLPQLGVRLFSIGDAFDSAEALDMNSALLFPMKNLINEMHVIATSEKVRASLNAKRQQGQLVANFAPFGYRKSSADKHKLEVDEPAAAVVRQIFAWRLDGLSAAGIARALNASDVPSPAAYRAACGQAYFTPFGKGVGQGGAVDGSAGADGGGLGGGVTSGPDAKGAGIPADKQPAWHAKTVLRILKNEVYTGTLVQGKTRHPSWRLRVDMPVPSEKWQRAPHAHEALVDIEEFVQVADLLAG